MSTGVDMPASSAVLDEASSSSKCLTGGRGLTLRPEDELVLLCARTQVDELTRQRILAIIDLPAIVDCLLS